MAAGDTFRAAASDQLEIWAERTGCEIVVAEKEKAKASSGMQLLMAKQFIRYSSSIFSVLRTCDLQANSFNS